MDGEGYTYASPRNLKLNGRNSPLTINSVVGFDVMNFHGFC